MSTTTTSITEAERLAADLEACAAWLRAFGPDLPDLHSAQIGGLTHPVATAYVRTRDEFHAAMTFLGAETIDDPRAGSDYVRASRIFGALAISVAAPIDEVCERQVTGIEIMPDGRRVEITELRLIPPGRLASAEENHAGIEAARDAITEALCGPGPVDETDPSPFTPSDPDGAPVVISEPDEIHRAFQS